MIVYRLAKSKYCNDLSGKGAEITGGRWNSKGTPLVYTSESRALCVAEIAVHMQLNILPVDFKLITIEIPYILTISVEHSNKLPKDWNSIPYSAASRKVGDEFINENKFPVLKVPSAVVPGDFNYLINPVHKLTNLIKIVKTEEFRFDRRLIWS